MALHHPQAPWWVSLVGPVLYAVVALLGVISWAASNTTRSDLLTSEIGQLRTTVTSGLDEIRKQIQGLPDQRAQLIQLTQGLNDLTPRVSAAERAIYALQAQADQSTHTGAHR